MLGSREVKRNAPSLADRHDATGEHTGAIRGSVTLEGQNSHAGIVVVQNFTLCRLPH